MRGFALGVTKNRKVRSRIRVNDATVLKLVPIGALNIKFYVKFEQPSE